MWDADDVSRAVNILEYSSENIASYTLEAPSGAGSNEADLAEKTERIGRVIHCGISDGNNGSKRTLSTLQMS